MLRWSHRHRLLRSPNDVGKRPRRDNAFLVAAVSLPLVVVAFFLLSTALPRRMVPPSTLALIVFGMFLIVLSALAFRIDRNTSGFARFPRSAEAGPPVERGGLGRLTAPNFSRIRIVLACAVCTHQRRASMCHAAQE
jgi:hypothetical protein